MQPEDLAGQLLGHYRIKRQIGFGGMARVFLAEDVHLEREVAVKVFSPRPGETQDFLRRFAREARVLAQLDHPQILPVYEYGEQDEIAYLVSPYMPGGTLKQKLQKQKVLPPSEAVGLLIQILPALQYAHERNLIHRDIKPGNLLFKADGTLVLADFGLVKVIGDESANKLETLNQTTQGITGTPEYMAPEQIEGKATPASDIYALGILLYELVTGTRPFTGENILGILVKHIHEQPRPPRELNPYISAQLEAIILRALEKDPQKRFARPADFQQALQQINSPQSGRVDNPASNPGLASSSTPIVDQTRTSAANWRQAPLTPIPTPPNSSPSSQGAGFQQTPTRGQGSDFPSMPSHGSGSYGGQPATNPSFGAGPTQPPQQPVVLPAQRQMSEPGFGQQSWTPPVPQPAGVADFTQQARTQMAASPSLVTQLPVTPPRKRNRAPFIILIVLLLLLVSVVATLFLSPAGASLLGRNPQNTPGTQQTPPASSATSTPTSQAGKYGGTTPATGPGNSAAATVQTTCPTDLARPAVMPALSLGHNQTIIYIENQGNETNPAGSALKAYNLSTGATKNLVQDANADITGAQISNDGQWVLFMLNLSGQYQLRLVRVDGQKEQTLLCAPNTSTVANAQWSLDQKYVVFDEFSQNVPTVYLLNIQTGALNTEVTPGSDSIGLIPRTWLDYTHVLLTANALSTDAPPQNIYVLNINNGPNQTISQTTKVWDSSQYSTCWDFDSSYDGKYLYIAQCSPGNPGGSSSIVKESSNGNAPGSDFTSGILAISTVRVIDVHDAHLLVLASDVSLGNTNGDPQHDGLYLITTSNGSLQRLTTTASGTYSSLNGTSQYVWSNVSRDGKMYALLTTQSSTNEYLLSYGNLSGGSPTVFAQSSATELAIAGWTTM